MPNFLHSIPSLTRAKDWRLSFVPFIIGCVYLWLWWFQIRVSPASVVLFILSSITTVGFAALGYFINEFFDIETDGKSGKSNKLGQLPGLAIAALLFFCLVVTFFPWIWLPNNRATLILITCEILLFLLYSLPFPRLKTKPVISSLIDSGYAYVVPLLLSFHTYSLFAFSEKLGIITLFAVAVFVIGFRNITIHHVNDIFKDIRSDTKTLPQVIGVKRTSHLILSALVSEIALMMAWGVMVTTHRPVFMLWPIAFLIFLLFRLKNFSKVTTLEYISIEPMRHFTDAAYQYIFPATALILAVTIDLRWLVILPFHVIFLLTKDMQMIAWETIYWKTVQLKYALIRTFVRLVIVPLSCLVNHIIFFCFLLFGVNLKKEKKSAFTVIKEFFNMNQ